MRVDFELAKGLASGRSSGGWHELLAFWAGGNAGEKLALCWLGSSEKDGWSIFVRVRFVFRVFLIGICNKLIFINFLPRGVLKVEKPGGQKKLKMFEISGFCPESCREKGIFQGQRMV
ncbi:MAG: hypothetical protein CSA68_10620 [Rhodobacterales bacterium]|nr:MAG: hypothetical protein CSA68_10620 [Rhodobacterales bacterium]